MRTISMFDWNGTLSQDMKADATKFRFTITGERVGDMGFVEFDLVGSDEDLDAFAEYYDVEFD